MASLVRSPIRVLVGFGALVLAAVTACHDSTAPGEDTALRVSHDAATLTLGNRGDEPLYFAAYDRRTVTMLQGPTVPPFCSEPSCPHVEPGARLEVPLTAVVGYDAETENVLVFWWRLVPRAGGGYTIPPGGVRSIDVAID